MTPERLPELIDFGAALFIVALGIGMVAAHTALAALAAARQSPAGAARLAPPALVGAYLAMWFGLALTVGQTHAVSRAGNPGLLLALIVGFGPAVLAVALLFGSDSVRRLYMAMPASWLIWVQTYRMAGLIFLFPFLYYGIVPADFAVPAALGDFVTGALALIVGLAVARNRPHALRWATAWNLFGLLDLIVAPVAAVLSQAAVLQLYPLALIPLFLGPPLGMLTHVYSLRSLAALASSRQHDGSPHAATMAGAYRTT